MKLKQRLHARENKFFTHNSFVTKPAAYTMAVKTTSSFSKIRRLIGSTWIANVFLLCILAIAGVSHGYNMFHYPYFENDEGTYISQAWSLLKFGKLAPYTYWYDHAPFGWILIAAWTIVTGGFFTFGPSIYSGRVFMLVIHIITSYFLFDITRKLSKSTITAGISVLLFSLSPLAIYFQRRVLLDNIMIFLVFFSIWILFLKNLKLRHVIASAFLFGASVLTKENAIFFFPVLIYIVFIKSHIHHRRIAITQWIVLSISFVSIYFLYAFLKSEFFPTGFLGDTQNHVSLISTLEQQLNRGSGLAFWQEKSDFYQNLKEWIRMDNVIIFSGIIATILNGLIAIKNKSFRIPFFLALSFWIFLLRGKLVINFYIIPLIPILALNISLLLNFIIRIIARKNILYTSVLVITLCALTYYFLHATVEQYTKDETTPQLMGLNWVYNHVDPKAGIAIDDFAYVDLKERGYENAEWFWKIFEDPQIQQKYQKDWKNIRYVFLTHEMLKQLKSRNSSTDLLKNSFTNSKEVVQYGPSKYTYLAISKYITTNGDWSAIYERIPYKDIILNQSWDYYKKNFIHSYGQVIDPATGNTTSEGQSYALLRAVWENDRKTFDGVYAWTADHMQYRGSDKLFSWLWVNKGTDGYIGDSSTATDADSDIALALLFASKRWNDTRYLTAAKEIISDMWNQEVLKAGNRYYLLSSSAAARPTGYLINPSYYSPYAYRIFAQVDTNHPWTLLADDTYMLLSKIRREIPGNKTGLVPNWVLLSKDTNTLQSASQYVSGNPDEYGYDAFRTIFRIGLDAKWNNNPQALSYLKTVSYPIFSSYNASRKLPAILDLEGNGKVSYNSISTDTAILSLAKLTKYNQAQDIYKKLFEDTFVFDKGYWGDGSNYYDQNWGWFSTALYTENLPNLWTNGSDRTLARTQ